jgi:hypothetical protein
MKAHLEKKKADDERNESLDALDNIGNIMSTKLAVDGRFHLNEQLRDKFRKDRNEKDEDNNRKSVRNKLRWKMNKNGLISQLQNSKKEDHLPEMICRRYYIGFRRRGRTHL